MSSAFDGLHSILGNSVVAVPDVGVTAVEEPAVAPPAPDPPRASKELASHPALSDLDRGLFATDDTHPTPNTDTTAALDALDRGLNEPGSLDVDADLFTRAPARPTRQPAPLPSSSRPVADEEDERQVSGWAAAAILAFGLVLGASAAIALFHDDVSHIVAWWDGASGSASARRR